MLQWIGPLVAAVACIAVQTASEPAAPPSPFEERGYYITFMRLPNRDLAAWKHIVDGVHDDGGNLLLRMDGRSIPFPQVPCHLELQAVFAMERSWCQPWPVVCPRGRGMKAQGTLTSAPFTDKLFQPLVLIFASRNMQQRPANLRR